MTIMAIHAYLRYVGYEGVELIGKDKEAGDSWGNPCIPWAN